MTLAYPAFKIAASAVRGGVCRARPSVGRVYGRYAVDLLREGLRAFAREA